MRISINEIKEYIKCPLFYKLKNIDNIPIEKTIDEYFKDYFKVSLYYYYFSLIENKQQSFEQMVKKWESLWFNRNMIEDFGEDMIKEKSNKAILMMSNFIKRFANEKSVPIATNLQYEAIFQGKENLHVLGVIDLIKIINDRTIKKETCLCDFSLSQKTPELFFMKNNLNLSVGSYAFRSSFKEKEDKVIVYSMNASEGVTTTYSGSDYLRSEKIIRNIYEGIRSGAFYPAPNHISCSKCGFMGFCLNEKSVNSRGGKSGS
jgi:hypothetical protein